MCFQVKHIFKMYLYAAFNTKTNNVLIKQHNKFIFLFGPFHPKKMMGHFYKI